MSALGPLTPNSGQHHASCGSPGRPGRAIRVSLPQFFCDVLPSSPFWPLVRFGSISVALAGCYFATALASLDENRTYTPPTVRDRPGSGMSASGRGAAIARCPLQVRDVPKQTLAAFV